MIDRTNASLDSGLGETPSPRRPFPTIRDSNRLYGAAVGTGLATALAYAVQPGVENEYGRIALALSCLVGVSATFALAVGGSITRTAVYLERICADQSTSHAPDGLSDDGE